MQTILAIDPGIGRTGWAILTKDGSKIQATEYDCIETKSTTPLPERLLIIYKTLNKIIAKHKPSVMVLERVFFNTNQKTATIVGQAQGVMMLSGAQGGLKIEFVTPLQIKQTVTGYGSSDKQQVQKMVMIILGIKEAPKLDDTADALACGVTYLTQVRILLA